jgi:hypothetical protein
MVLPDLLPSWVLMAAGGTPRGAPCRPGGEVPQERAAVATGQGNHPARRLYEQVGFVHRADVTIASTLVVSPYERPTPSSGRPRSAWPGTARSCNACEFNG